VGGLLFAPEERLEDQELAIASSKSRPPRPPKSNFIRLDIERDFIGQSAERCCGGMHAITSSDFICDRSARKVAHELRRMRRMSRPGSGALRRLFCVAALVVGSLTAMSAIASPGTAAEQQVARAPDHFVLSHVSVIDTTGGPIKADMSVEVRGNRIVSIKPSSRHHTAGAATTIDGTGKFLIPGLWDMHVHTGQRDIYLPLYIANGVTGVRDMGGDLEEPTGYSSARFVQLALWRAAIRQGRLIGPRMVLAGFLIDGFAWPGDVVATNANEGRDAVRVLKRMGVDFIKVKSGLSRDAYFAIAYEAGRQHIDFAGHIPDSVRAIEACEAGQRSVEHLTGIALASSGREQALDNEINRAIAARDRARYDRGIMQAANSFDAATARKLFACFVRNEVWQVPTLVELRRNALGDPDPNDPHLQFLPPTLLEQWAREGAATPTQEGASLFAKDLALTRTMHDTHVRFMTGTDSANPSIVPGFALHDELALFVQAGFTPMQALQAATINPARYLGKDRQLGTIEAGKLADMVLLDANPLADIGNTRAIAAVIANGRYFSREDLDAMLARVKAQH
jgi:Amidohydrolase family